LFSANKNEKKLVSTAGVLVYTAWYIHIINGRRCKNKQNLKGHTFFQTSCLKPDTSRHLAQKEIAEIGCNLKADRIVYTKKYRSQKGAY
ncbi:MAG: hypothetical protein ACTHZU_02170, partial [Lacticaseibacillus paracasei]